MNKSDQMAQQQRDICARFGCEPESPAPNLKIGIARNVKSGSLPINGMRIAPQGETTGWFIWGGEGEPSGDADFFVPLHIDHVDAWSPLIAPYLALAPGWRFIVAPGYEDVWFDAELLSWGDRH